MLGVLRLEDRTVPATSISIVSGANGSGSLDSLLFDASPGVILGADGGSVAGTLSSGALAAVTSTTNISITAQTSITINNLAGTLALQTTAGRTATFIAQGGGLTFANVSNTLSTAGGGLTLTASTNETIGQLATGGGGLSLTASGGTLTQSGTANAGAGVVNVSASGNLTMDAVTGSTVTLTSTNGAINSASGNRIAATTRLNLTARTGITVNSQAVSVQAGNSTSGNISVTQAATPAQALTTAGTGVVNSAPGGSVTLTNLGAAITVAGTSSVQSSNGPVTLAALDFTVAGAVSSGTGRTTLANSTAGRQFDLGTNTAGKIGLTQAELNSVTAGVLQVGSDTAGMISVSAAIGPFAGSNTLALVNNDVVTQTTASLTVPDLRVSSSQVGMGGANNVGTLAASVSAGNLVFDANNPLMIGTVDGASGIATTGGSVSLFADAVDVQQAVNVGTGLVQISPLTNGAQISLGSEVAGRLSLTDAELGRVTAGTLRVGAGTTPGSIAINGPVTRHAGYNTLSLSTGGTLTQTAALSVANLAVTTTGGVALTNAGNDFDTLAAQVTGGGIGFSDTDANALTVGTVDGVNGITTNAGPVTLTTGGSITDGNGAAKNVTASSLTANAVASIDLDTDVGALSMGMTGAGAINLTEAGTATIGTLSPGTGTITLGGGTFDLGGSNAMTGNLIVAGATLNLGAFAQIMTSVQLTSGNILGTGTLSSVFDFDVRSGSIAAKLGGGVGLNKTTTGTVTLSGANTYAGTTTVSGGTLLINGSQAPGSSVTVDSGGVLGGTGTVAAGVTLNSGGTLAPGTGLGIIGTGNLQLASGTTFTTDLNGPYATAGTDYDRVNVAGTVNLNSATLTLVGGTIATTAGQVLTIISNDGTDAVVGTFAGRPQNSTLSVGSFYARISYTGGDGNDVTLTTLTTPPAVVQSVMIDNGTAQRSMVRSATVTFGRVLNFTGSPTAAFRLARTGPGTPTGNVTLAVDLSGSTATQTVARLTFTGALTEGANSLIDGSYTLTVLSAQVQGGIQGGDNVSTMFRLYGDINGDKAVNGLDLNAFRNAFGTTSADAGYMSFLDFNGDGAINGTDLTQFRNRFGVILP
jgi:hypothetical protein